MEFSTILLLFLSSTPKPGKNWASLLGGEHDCADQG